MLIIEVPHRVFEDGGVAVTQLVILLYEFLLVLLVTLGGVLLRLEETGQLACLVNLCKGTLAEQSAFYLVVREFLVALDDYLVNLHLLFLVYKDVENHLVLGCHIIALCYLDISVLITLVVEIFLCQYLGTVNHVRRNLRAFQQTQFLLHILALTLLQTDVVDGAHARTECEVEMQVSLVANDGVGTYGNL